MPALHASPGRRPLLLGLALLMAGATLLGGLATLHASRTHQNVLHDAASDLATTVAGLASVKWQVMAVGHAQSGEGDQATALISAGDRNVEAIIALRPEGQTVTVDPFDDFVGTIVSRRPTGPDVNLVAVWREYRSGVMQVVGFVEQDNLRSAEIFEGQRVEPIEELLAALITTLRDESQQSYAHAERVQVIGSVLLIVLLLAAFTVAMTLAQRRRRSAAVAGVMRSAQDALRHQATHDGLTGLANRGLFSEAASIQAADQRPLGAGFAILMVDFDHFKEINDSLGHRIGDAMLKALSDRLRAAVRERDLVARIGGDEFAILVSDVRDEAVPVRLAQRILSQLAEPVEVGDQLLVIRASIGIAVSPQHGIDPDQLLHRADMAMYRAKEQRNAYAVFSPAGDAAPPVLV